MALMLRRRLPLVIGPLILGPLVLSAGFHLAKPQLIANDGVSSPRLLNPAQVSARLRAHQNSVLVDRGPGVLRYDSAQLPSNDPIEDAYGEAIVQVPLVSPTDIEFVTDWYFWGIYDGHAGSSTSAQLREQLIPAAIRNLNQCYPEVAPNSLVRQPPSLDTPEVIDAALTQAFVKLDHQIVHENVEKLLKNPSREEAIAKLPPALSGSCALLAFYDSYSQMLRLALAGDSRAVLGVRNAQNQWTAQSLTADQTGSNEDEIRRIRAEHPQSEQSTCVRRGRVLGIYEPTRCFGDAVVKWSRDVQRKVSNLFFSTHTPSTLLTPPYLTAEPVVTRVKLDLSAKPCFVVMASDGLFEMLSNDQVVSLVVDWLQEYQPAYLNQFALGGADSQPPSKLKSWGSKLFSSSKSKRQIGDSVEDVTKHKEKLKEPIAMQHMNTPPLKVATQDKNVATHLIRNALGGGDSEQVSLLLSIPSPMSRNYRDDLSVTVIFFGNQSEGTGSVVTNDEAANLRARL